MLRMIYIMIFLFAITSVMAEIRSLKPLPEAVKGGYKLCNQYDCCYYAKETRLVKQCYGIYDNNGLLESSYYINDDSSVNSITKYRYDILGNVTLRASLDSYGNDWSWQNYKRDEEGRVLEFINWNKRMDTSSIFIHQYKDDEENVIIRYGHSELGQKTKYMKIYDEQGNLIEKFGLRDGEIIYKMIYKYNEYGLLTESLEYGPKSIQQSLEKIIYDKFGQIKEKNLYKNMSFPYGNSSWAKKIYNNNQQIIELIYYNNNEPYSRTLYTYDNFGNLTKGIFYYNNEIWRKTIYQYSK